MPPPPAPSFPPCPSPPASSSSPCSSPSGPDSTARPPPSPPPSAPTPSPSFHPADPPPPGPSPPPTADSLRAALRHRAHVSAARPIHPGIPDAPAVLLATDEHWLAAHGWRILRGRPLDGADIHRAAPVILLPDAAARAARLSPGDAYPLGPATLTLVGTTTAPADTPPLVPFS